MWEIRADDLSDPMVRAFVDEHLDDMYAQTPPASVHALGVAALRMPQVRLFTAWREGALAGMGAYVRIGPLDAEVKAMRTSIAARGRGLGRVLLNHLIAGARAERIRTLWLETGSGPKFAAARGLYEAEGFVPCPPFGDYGEDPESVFYHRDI
ncbi:GNAT family N-acetyltransferase [Microbacterium sp.]|uniref:GNAT family N-acetyltransferase n=1 Tax=Microbacterium sp. TaxID=51671 RepID=UPI002810B480|nr:GNAT family N-acetyltransferase [Microbacterium sp.]